MNRTGFLIVLTILAFATVGHTQPTDTPPNTLWTQTYGGYNQDKAYSVQQTNDGGYIIAGATQSFGSGNWDFYLVKTDADGNKLWSRTYGGNDLDFAYYTQQTNDGGYIVAGYTTSFGQGGKDFYLVKTDCNGNTLWTRTYGGTSNDICYSAEQTADGGYVLAGCTFSYGMGANDYYLVKTDFQGNPEWTQTYGSTGTEECYDVEQTIDGGYILAGFSAPYGNGSQRAWLVKTDSVGVTIWTAEFDGTGYDYAMSVQQTTGGGYIAAGRTTSFGAINYDYYLIKTDADGNSLWTRTYGGAGIDQGFAVAQSSDGGYIVSGYTTSYGAGDWDFYLVRTDESGESLWTATYGGFSTDECRSIIQTNDGGFVAAGNTGSFGAGSRDFYVVCLASDVSLHVDVSTISESTGGAVNFTLNVGTANANRNYILLGSVTGTEPGTSLPVGQATLPLNWDIFTSLVIDLINTPVFSNFLGKLNGNGSATATFDTIAPLPGTAGLNIHFAYALNNPWNFASNPVGIEIVP